MSKYIYNISEGGKCWVGLVIRWVGKGRTEESVGVRSVDTMAEGKASSKGLCPEARLCPVYLRKSKKTGAGGLEE